MAHINIGRLTVGFTLIEFIITLSIIVILAAVSLPFYSTYLVRERRLEAAEIISRVALAMEEHQLSMHTYQVSLNELGFTDYIVKNFYQLKLVNATENSYEIHAVPLLSQAERDKTCGTLIYQSTGEKSMTGFGNSETCW